jgi:predicted amidohydrolase
MDSGDTVHAPAESCLIAVVQHAPVFLNLDASLDRACSLIEEAAGQGADLIAFPETWLAGYPVWLDRAPKAALWGHAPAKALYRLLVENSITLPGRHLSKLLAVARDAGTCIVMGAHERFGGTLFNTMIIIGKDGQEYRIHRKLVPTYTERLLWGRGDGSTLGVMDTGFGRVGGLICWEHWMPLARAAMHAQHETLHIAQWPAVGKLHQLASRHYAFEGQCYVIAAGSVLSRGEVLEGVQSLGPAGRDALQLLETIPGSDADLLLRGGSAIIAPNARYVEGPVFGKECILYTDLDLGLVVEGQMALDTAGHYARPDIFRLEVDDRPQTNVSFRSQDDAAQADLALGQDS